VEPVVPLGAGVAAGVLAPDEPVAPAGELGPPGPVADGAVAVVRGGGGEDDPQAVSAAQSEISTSARTGITLVNDRPPALLRR
jgi:hypothetical protein